MIELRLFANLPELARSRKRRVEVTFRPGLTVGDVMAAEGLAGEDVRIILLNGVHASPQAELADGDGLSFFPALGGG